MNYSVSYFADEHNETPQPDSRDRTGPVRFTPSGHPKPSSLTTRKPPGIFRTHGPLMLVYSVILLAVVVWMLLA
ncbi:MAG: hypothetical protein ACREJD_10955 [Phycisphaerales bacterium]